MDAMLKVWDIRTYQPLHSLYIHKPATDISISQRGLIATGHGKHCQVRERKRYQPLYSQYNYAQTEGERKRELSTIHVLYLLLVLLLLMVLDSLPLLVHSLLMVLDSLHVYTCSSYMAIENTR